MKKPFILISLLLFAVLLLYWQFPYALKSSESKADLTYFLILVGTLILGLSQSKYRASDLIQNSVIWVCIILILLIGYSYKDVILGQLIPSKPIIRSDGSFTITSSLDRHFHIQAELNNHVVDCIIDTGATTIVIDVKDASASGIDTERLAYNIPAETAGGLVYSARTNVAKLKIGDIELKDTSILVNKTEMGSCLLGMTFLNTFKKISIEGDKMIISPQD